VPIVFRAPAAEVSGATADDTGASADTVEITLEGYLYDPPLVRGPVDRDTASWDTPVDTVVSEFSALRSDDIQWILSNAVFEDRKDLGAQLLDDVARTASVEFFSRIKELRVWGQAFYRKNYPGDVHDDFAFIVFSYDDSPERNVDTYKHTSEGWKTTGELDEDATAEIVRAAVASGSFGKM